MGGSDEELKGRALTVVASRMIDACSTATHSLSCVTQERSLDYTWHTQAPLSGERGRPGLCVCSQAFSTHCNPSHSAAHPIPRTRNSASRGLGRGSWVGQSPGRSPLLVLEGFWTLAVGVHQQVTARETPSWPQRAVNV